MQQQKVLRVIIEKKSLKILNMEQIFLEKLKEILEMDAPVKMEDNFREYEVWDSLAYLSVISFVDEEYETVIPRDEFKKMNTVQDIFNYIKNNKVK